MLKLSHLGRQTLLPGPHRLVRGRLRYVALVMVVLGVLTVLGHLRPAPFTATWWIGMAFLAMGLVIPFINWRRLPASATVPFCLAGDVLAGAILWLNPSHSDVGMLYIMLSTFVAALFSNGVVVVHVALVAAALGGHLLLGGDAATTWFVALSNMSLMAFLRAMNYALERESSRVNTLQTMLELLPVLKAHSVREVVREAVNQLVKATASDSGIIMLTDADNRRLRTHYQQFERPIPAEEEAAWASLEFDVGTGLAGWVALHREPILTGDAERDPRAVHVPGTPPADESLMVVPLISGGTLLGVLRLHREGLDKYTEADLDLLKLMSAHVADALARAALEERVSRTDALTGVYNRHFLNEWSTALKPSDREVSVLMIDCRRFKQINDQFGHLTGDWVLQEASRLIRESVRAGDLIVRYGGDEFLVVLSHTGAEQASAVAARLCDRVECWNRLQPPDRPTLALDIGVDTATEARWGDLLERADAHMYASKRAS